MPASHLLPTSTGLIYGQCERGLEGVFFIRFGTPNFLSALSMCVRSELVKWMHLGGHATISLGLWRKISKFLAWEHTFFTKEGFIRTTVLALIWVILPDVEDFLLFAGHITEKCGDLHLIPLSPCCRPPDDWASLWRSSANQSPFLSSQRIIDSRGGRKSRLGKIASSRSQPRTTRSVVIMAVDILSE